MTPTRFRARAEGAIRAAFAKADAAIASLPPVDPLPEKASLAQLLRHAGAAGGLTPDGWRQSIDATHVQLLRDLSRADTAISEWSDATKSIKTAIEILAGAAKTLPDTADPAVRMSVLCLKGTEHAQPVANILRDELAIAQRSLDAATIQMVKSKSAASAAHSAWLADRAKELKRSDAFEFEEIHKDIVRQHKRTLNRIENDPARAVAEYRKARKSEESAA